MQGQAIYPRVWDCADPLMRHVVISQKLFVVDLDTGRELPNVVRVDLDRGECLFYPGGDDGCPHIVDDEDMRRRYAVTTRGRFAVRRKRESA